MGLANQIKQTTGLNDLTSVKLTLDDNYSKTGMLEKALQVAEISGGAIAYYSGSGRHLEVIVSQKLKHHFETLKPGTKVRYEVKTDDGSVIDDMTRHGVIPEGSNICYVSGSPAIRVDFGKGGELYDAINLIVEE